MKKALIFLSLMTSTLVAMPQPDPNEMLADFDFISRTFKNHYGPREWKEKQLNLDIQQEFADGRDQIINGKIKTYKNFHQLIHRIQRSLHDYHVTFVVANRERCFLPFTVNGVGKRYFVGDVIRELLPKKIKLNPGDEILSMNGQPIHNVIVNLQKELYGTTDNLTDRSFAMEDLTARVGALIHPVQKGDVTLKTKTKGGEKVTSKLRWYYTAAFPQKKSQSLAAFQEDQQKNAFGKAHWMGRPMLQQEVKARRKLHGLMGSKESFFPDLGPIAWKAPKDAPIHAYVWENDDQALIGYLRIPSFGFSKAYFDYFRKVISFFEENTDALVIDQMDNPGGIDLVTFALCRHLIKDKAVLPKHHQLISINEAHEASSNIEFLELITSDKEAQEYFGKTFYTYPMDYKLIQNWIKHYHFIVNEWMESHFFTEPTAFSGIEEIEPAEEQSYTKPILLLVNEKAMSCGDIFPAIMQDNDRATLMGRTTMGAGGCVEMVQFPNCSGVQAFAITRSLIVRSNGEKIEGIGVTPDVPYETTVEDLQHQHRGFRKAVRAEVANLLAR